jgi:hypothetical protein
VVVLNGLENLSRLRKFRPIAALRGKEAAARTASPVCAPPPAGNADCFEGLGNFHDPRSATFLDFALG